ncbi:MAG TPA: hypothetical protein VMT30_05420 [Candidatus Saccharimonadia bacterium]|nr:hypothetical protein [Candidatus Saccharimonadia bacterium]
MARPATVKTLSARWMRRCVGLVVGPDADLAPLLDATAGRRLSYSRLRQAATTFVEANPETPGALTIMNLMVPIWARPKLWFLNFCAWLGTLVE